MEDNIMLTMPVKKLMLKMGIPVMCSMALQAVYNIVDSAFVSNMPEVGELALNALTLAFPAQLLMIAVSIGLGIGVSVAFSRSMGQRNHEQVNRVTGNAVFLSLCAAVIFILFGFFGAEFFIGSQTSNPLVAEMAVDYLRICCIFSVGLCLFGTFEKFLQSSGLALYSTIAQIAGALTNIVLDPILIYGLAGAPALGVKGAAIATVAGQFVSCTTAVLFHLTLNKDVTNHIRYMKPHPLIIQQIFRIGLPAMIAQGLVSLTAYLLNIIFITIDEMVVTVYGLYYKIQQFVLLISFGLRDASTPIIATAYGLQNKTRIRDGIKYSLIIATVIMIGGTLIFEVFASPIAAAFGLSGAAQALCINAIRIISISLIFAGINIAIQGIMQSLNAGLNSLIISVCRQFIFIIPVAYGLTQLVLHGNLDINLVWYTFLIGEGITCAISIILMKRTNQTTISPLQQI